MTRKNTIQLPIIAVTIVAMVGLLPVVSYAGERIGDLVFKTMKKIESRQKDFLRDVKEMRSERVKAINEKEQIRKRFMKTRDGSVDRQEAHAELSYTLARIYKYTFSELKLVRSTASDHIKSLTVLKNGLKAGKTGMNQRATEKIVRDTSGFIKSSNSLLLSLGKYTDVITDPRINRKLRAARSTALLLDNYVNNLRKNRLTGATSRQTLRGKVEELVNHMEELYLQTDILLEMIQDKTSILKMINQIAISELAAIRLANGRSIVSSISDEVLKPLKEVLKESDNDLDLLTEGVVTGGGTHAPLDQSWSKGLK